MMQARKQTILALACLGTSLGVAGPSLASNELPMTPLNKRNVPPAKSVGINVIQRGSYDSNPLKLVSGYESLKGTETMGQLTINNRTPTSTLRSVSDISHGFYDNADFNTTNFHENVLLDHKTERWKAALTGKLDYDTTRSSEITSYGIRAPNVRHTQVTASPDIQFKPTAATTLGLKSVWTDSSFESASFVDYTMSQLQPSAQLKLDDVHTALIRYNYQDFQSHSPTNPTGQKTFGPSFGWISELSPRLTMQLTAGFEKNIQIQSVGARRKRTRDNQVFSASFLYETEQQRLNFSATRDQRPTGNGVSALMTTFNLSEDYILNQRISLRGSATYRSATYTDRPGVNLKTDLTLMGGMAYRLLDTLDLTANYANTNQKLTLNTGKVRAQTVMLGLSYHPFEWGL